MNSDLALASKVTSSRQTNIPKPRNSQQNKYGHSCAGFVHSKPQNNLTPPHPFLFSIKKLHFFGLARGIENPFIHSGVLRAEEETKTLILFLEAILGSPKRIIKYIPKIEIHHYFFQKC